MMLSVGGRRVPFNPKQFPVRLSPLKSGGAAENENIRGRSNLGLIVSGKGGVCHALTNPDFETGDFTGWGNEGTTEVTDTEKHSGNYSAQFHQYPKGANIWQDIVPAIPKSDIASWTLWHKETDAIIMHAGWKCILTYDDETTTEWSFDSSDWGFDQQWHEFDILAIMEDKNVEKIELQFSCATLLYGWIDDVLLTCL